ncbi:MAG: metallophosphoesterase [Deltaproteobacteria bacterium]|nr:metallophosphoesterase [Deltaproteobacteria bacterium]
MKILSISDILVKELETEFDGSIFEGIDLILSCGDLPPEYLTKVMTLVGAPLFYIKGNHDIRYQSKPPQGCLDLHRKIIKFKGYKIIGFDGSNWYNGGPNQYTDKQMKKMIKSLRASIWFNKGVDIVLTHAPPRYLGDAEDRCHMGFDSFRNLISKYKPEYFVHGHIHKAFKKNEDRVTVFNQTKIINSCGYHIFEI